MNTKWLTNIIDGCKKHSPAILTGMAIAGTIGAVVSAIIMKPKYDQLINEKKEEAEANETEVTKKDIIVAGFKAYWPTLILIAASAGCAIGANVINSKRVAGAMAAAAGFKKLADDTLAAAEKKLNTNKMKEMTDEIAKSRMSEGLKEVDPEKIPKQKYAKEGTTLLYDCWLGKPFYGDRNKIFSDYVTFKDAYFNHGDDDVRLESFYMELDIPFNKTPAIKHQGWKLGRELPEFKWVPMEIPDGPMAGQLCHGLQWCNGSMPELLVYS